MKGSQSSIFPVSKLVRALVIIYDKIFRALVVGDILLLKPFLDLGFDSVIRWKLPDSEMFPQFAEHAKVKGN